MSSVASARPSGKAQVSDRRTGGGTKGKRALSNGFSHHEPSAVSAGANAGELNLLAVRKVDESVVSIVSTVPQVVLYEYDRGNNEWERTSIEGTLFICDRSSIPQHNFVLLNRLSSESLLQLLPLGMDFKIKEPFVLFKRGTGNIHGLCFTDEALCQSTGLLLRRLSSGTSVLSKAYRSGSAPALAHHLSTAETSELRETSDVSRDGTDDSTGSGSPTSEVISFTTSADSRSEAPAAPRPRAGQSPGLSESSSASLAKNLKDRRKRNQGTTSPRNQGPPRGGQTPTARSGSASASVSPQPGEQRQQRSGKTGSQRGRQLAASPKKAQQRQTRGAQTQVRLEHAHSFDSKMYAVEQRRAEPNVDLNKSLPGSRSSSPYSAPPPPSSSSASSPWTQNPSHAPNHALHVDGTEENDTGSNLVRRLFVSDPSNATAHPPPPSSSSTSSLTALQSLFSRPSSTGASQPTASGPPPLRAMSLAELERQMKEEALSPDGVNPLVSLGLIPWATTTTAGPATHGASTVSAAGSSAGSAAVTRSVSVDDGAKLLQPSAFSASAKTVPPSGTPQRSDTAPVVSLSASLGSAALSILSPPRSFTSPATLPPTISADSLSISVQPPSPSVSLNSLLTPSTSARQSKSVGFSCPQSPPSFPPIPPLMLSPGMRAAPVKNPPQEEAHRGSVPKGQVGAHNLHASIGPVTEKPSSSHHESKVGGATASTVKETRAGSDPSQHPAVATVAATTDFALDPSSVGGQPPPSLMSPRQFTGSPEAGAGLREAVPPQGTSSGLNHDQFKQAMLQLIQNDDGFVATLHQAYLKVWSGTA